MKRQAGWPATVKILTRFGYDPKTVMEKKFGPFGYIKREPEGKAHHWHKPVLGQIAYAVFIWEKYHNFH